MDQPYEDDVDNVVVMVGTWSLYQELLATRGERPQPRFAYLDGQLELMTTSRRHEVVKMMLGRLLDVFAEESGGQLNATGQATLKHTQTAGAEPANSYFVDELKEFPDLVVEVVHTHKGVDKLEIYRRMGVAEVWCWMHGSIAVYQLEGGRYRMSISSQLFPGIDLAEIAQILHTTEDPKQLEAIRAYRAALRKRFAKPRKRATPKRR